MSEYGKGQDSWTLIKIIGIVVFIAMIVYVAGSFANNSGATTDNIVDTIEHTSDGSESKLNQLVENSTNTGTENNKETEVITEVYLGKTAIESGVSNINDNEGITIKAGETVFVDGISVSIPSSAKLSSDEDRTSFYISNVRRVGTDKMTFCVCTDYTVVINEIKGVLFLKEDDSGMTLEAFFNGESVKETRISIPPGKKINIEMILYEESFAQFFSRDEMKRVDIVIGAKKIIS